MLIGGMLFFFCINIFSATPCSTKQDFFKEEHIKQYKSSFKKEILAIKRLCTVIIAVGCISYSYQGVQTVRSLFGFNAPTQGNWFSNIIPSFIQYIFSLGQYALATYILQKLLGYGIRYYVYEYPINWLLNHRTPVARHLDTLLQSIAMVEKKNKLHTTDTTFKTSIPLFVEMIVRDIEQLCAFMEYRANMLPAYKSATIDLIKQQIVSITKLWLQTIESELNQKSFNTHNIQTQIIQFKSLLFEQIDLFKKIDDEGELLRDIFMLTELNS